VGAGCGAFMSSKTRKTGGEQERTGWHRVAHRVAQVHLWFIDGSQGSGGGAEGVHLSTGGGGGGVRTAWSGGTG